jgi:prepilin peptidase CpaA
MHPAEPFVMRIALLLILLALASLTDIREHRIPNGIPASLLLAALVLGVASDGPWGGLRAAGGGAVGLLVLLPFYLLGGMAAGDVKLMTGAGALLGGPAAALFAAAATLLIGGILALGYAAARLGRARMAAARPGTRTVGWVLTAGQWVFPYALAILGGTLAALVAAPRWAAVAGVG